MFIETLSEEAYLSFSIEHSGNQPFLDLYLGQTFYDRDLNITTELCGYVSVKQPIPKPSYIAVIKDPHTGICFLPLRFVVNGFTSVTFFRDVLSMYAPLGPFTYDEVKNDIAVATFVKFRNSNMYDVVLQENDQCS